MAELHRVEINEKVSSEIEPEEKQQADETVETPEEQQSERPEWLPEKFKSAEDMANAYSELEKKLGQPAAEEQQEEEQPQQEETENDNDKPEAGNYNEAVVEASQEFFANDGQLSDETYQKLEQVGLPRDLVDSYAAGQQALLQSEETQIKGVAGSDYDAMAEWANEHLPSEEVDAFDEAVTSGSIQQAKLAVQGLHARYQNATGSRPKTLVQGAVSGSSTMPFKSMQELARAQSDPRYRSGDKAYHQEIDRRLAVSNI
jgi:ATP-dependent exoDNAse (exonuclease V) beta subunit